MVPIEPAHSERSNEPAHVRILARAFASHLQLQGYTKTSNGSHATNFFVKFHLSVYRVISNEISCYEKITPFRDFWVLTNDMKNFHLSLFLGLDQ